MELTEGGCHVKKVTDPESEPKTTKPALGAGFREFKRGLDGS